MNWIDVNDSRPKCDFNEPEKEYYIVYVEDYGWMKAMYMNGGWWNNYVCSIHGKVTHWMKVIEPQYEKT